VCTSFIQSLDVSANSVRTYREGLKSFARWWEERGRPPLDSEALKAYREELRVRRAANTVLTYWVALRRFFRYAARATGHRGPPGERGRSRGPPVTVQET
jgi:site-specific recombinase XerD